MKTIQLTNGGETQVDDEDYEYLNQFKWYKYRNLEGYWYVCRVSGKTLIYSLIMNTPPKLMVDHIDHDRFNNQKLNLRICTNAQNQQNRLGASRNSKTGVRGVCYRGDSKFRLKPYTATVQVLTTHQKTFTTLEEASEWVSMMRDKLMTHHKG